MILKLQNFIPIPFCGCHLWLGSVDKDGYGTIGRVGGAHLKAHRESFREYVCDPGDFHVLHKCDLPPCINPAHLYLGDPATNGLDKKLRGRARTQPRPGELNPMARFTQLEVDRMRKFYSDGMLQKDVAKIFNTSQPVVSKIVNFERW